MNWDTLVDWTLARGLRGLENLALIPGQAGAAPIQNIGAYGVEIGEFVAAVEAYDRIAGHAVRLSAQDCTFGYRDSLFKRDPDRYVVTAIELDLPRDAATNLAYAGLREELVAMGDAPATPRNVATAVRRIRRRKLPDPAVIGNAGSFFKNPIVAQAVADELRGGSPTCRCSRRAGGAAQTLGGLADRARGLAGPPGRGRGHFGAARAGAGQSRRRDRSAAARGWRGAWRMRWNGSSACGSSRNRGSSAPQW